MDAIRTFMSLHGLNQGEFAELCGISRPTVVKILKGDRGVGMDVARKIVSGTKGRHGAIKWDDLLPQESAA